MALSTNSGERNGNFDDLRRILPFRNNIHYYSIYIKTFLRKLSKLQKRNKALSRRYLEIEKWKINYCASRCAKIIKARHFSSARFAFYLRNDHSFGWQLGPTDTHLHSLPKIVPTLLQLGFSTAEEKGNITSSLKEKGLEDEFCLSPFSLRLHLEGNFRKRSGFKKLELNSSDGGYTAMVIEYLPPNVISALKQIKKNAHLSSWCLLPHCTTSGRTFSGVCKRREFHEKVRFWESLKRKRRGICLSGQFYLSGQQHACFVRVNRCPPHACWF